jgi:hypothetical protein
MQRAIAVVGIIVCAFFAYVNLSEVNTRRDYIEACLYITNRNESKDDCYDVYPENHSRDALLWGVVSSVGVLVFMGMFIANKPHPEHDEEH